MVGAPRDSRCSTKTPRATVAALSNSRRNGDSRCLNGATNFTRENDGILLWIEGN